MLYSIKNRTPQINGNNIFIAEQACIIGSVIIGNNVCILPQAVIRADNDAITIGAGSNVQDGAVIHTDSGIKVSIGKNVTIGHNAMLHGCNVGDYSVIGIGAIVLSNAVIGKNCIIGANALVLENTIIPDGSLVVGSPAKVKRKLTDDDTEKMKGFAAHYIDKIAKYNNDLVKIN